MQQKYKLSLKNKHKNEKNITFAVKSYVEIYYDRKV